MRTFTTLPDKIWIPAKGTRPGVALKERRPCTLIGEAKAAEAARLAGARYLVIQVGIVLWIFTDRPVTLPPHR